MAAEIRRVARNFMLMIGFEFELKLPKNVICVMIHLMPFISGSGPAHELVNGASHVARSGSLVVKFQPG